MSIFIWIILYVLAQTAAATYINSIDQDNIEEEYKVMLVLFVFFPGMAISTMLTSNEED